MTEHDDDRLGVEKVEPKSSNPVPNEDELRAKRAQRDAKSSEGDRRKDDEAIDEASDESFPASDPPSYSKGLPRTE